MKIWGKVHAIKIYPSGGLIYQATRYGSTMSVPKAVREHVNNRPALIAIDDIRAFQIAMSAIMEVNKEGSN